MYTSGRDVYAYACVALAPGLDIVLFCHIHITTTPVPLWIEYSNQFYVYYEYVVCVCLIIFFGITMVLESWPGCIDLSCTDGAVVSACVARMHDWLHVDITNSGPCRRAGR